MTMEVYGAFWIKPKTSSIKPNGAFLIWHVDRDTSAYSKREFQMNPDLSYVPNRGWADSKGSYAVQK